MTSPRRTPRLAFDLMTAERSLRRWIDHRTQGSPVGAAGAGVLFFLARNEPAPVKDIAAALAASPAGTTGLVNRLAGAGVVSKTTDPNDARSALVTLTDAGRAELSAAKGILADLNQHLTADFTPDELDIVHRWLTQVRALPR